MDSWFGLIYPPRKKAAWAILEAASAGTPISQGLFHKAILQYHFHKGRNLLLFFSALVKFADFWCAEFLRCVPKSADFFVCRNLRIFSVPKFDDVVDTYIILQSKSSPPLIFCVLKLADLLRAAGFRRTTRDFGPCESVLEKCTRKASPEEAFSLVCRCAQIWRCGS